MGDDNLFTLPRIGIAHRSAGKYAVLLYLRWGRRLLLSPGVEWVEWVECLLLTLLLLLALLLLGGGWLFHFYGETL